VIFRSVNKRRNEARFVGHIDETSIERNACGLAARLRFDGARRNTLAENRNTAEQA
jgi:hypothetical protein